MTGGARAQRRTPPPHGAARLWFGLLAGHASWTAQLLLTYLAVSLACRGESDGAAVLGVPIVPTLLALLTLGPVALAAAGAVVALRAWRAARSDGAAGWRGFLGLFGALLSGLFVGVILLTGASLLFLDPCD